MKMKIKSKRKLKGLRIPRSFSLSSGTTLYSTQYEKLFNEDKGVENFRNEIEGLRTPSTVSTVSSRSPSSSSTSSSSSFRSSPQQQRHGLTRISSLNNLKRTSLSNFLCSSEDNRTDSSVSSVSNITTSTTNTPCNNQHYLSSNASAATSTSGATWSSYNSILSSSSSFNNSNSTVRSQSRSNSYCSTIGGRSPSIDSDTTSVSSSNNNKLLALKAIERECGASGLYDASLVSRLHNTNRSINNPNQGCLTLGHGHAVDLDDDSASTNSNNGRYRTPRRRASYTNGVKMGGKHEGGVFSHYSSNNNNLSPAQNKTSPPTKKAKHESTLSRKTTPTKSQVRKLPPRSPKTRKTHKDANVDVQSKKNTRILILLLHPSTRKFELIPITCNASSTKVNYVLQTLIPLYATEKVLQNQVYIGLCRSSSPKAQSQAQNTVSSAAGLHTPEMIPSFALSEYDIQPNEILIAIPKGEKEDIIAATNKSPNASSSGGSRKQRQIRQKSWSANDCLRMGNVILSNPKVTRLVRYVISSGISSNSSNAAEVIDRSSGSGSKIPVVSSDPVVPQRENEIQIVKNDSNSSSVRSQIGGSGDPSVSTAFVKRENKMEIVKHISSVTAASSSQNGGNGESMLKPKVAHPSSQNGNNGVSSVLKLTTSPSSSSPTLAGKRVQRIIFNDDDSNSSHVSFPMKSAKQQQFLPQTNDDLIKEDENATNDEDNHSLSPSTLKSQSTSTNNNHSLSNEKDKKDIEQCRNSGYTEAAATPTIEMYKECITTALSKLILSWMAHHFPIPHDEISTGMKNSNFSKSSYKYVMRLLILLLILPLVLLHQLHNNISSPLRPGDVLQPGQWRSKCGLLGMVFNEGTTNCHPMAIEMRSDGVLSFYDGGMGLEGPRRLLWEIGTNHDEIEKKRGRSDGSRGVEDTLLGSLILGNHYVRTVNSNKVASRNRNAIREQKQKDSNTINCEIESDGALLIQGKPAVILTENSMMVTNHNKHRRTQTLSLADGMMSMEELLSPWPFLIKPPSLFVE